MRRAESIVHVKVSDLREFFRKCRIVRLFLFVITDILQQHDLARQHGADDSLHFFADAIIDKIHVMTEQVGQFGRDWAQRHRRLSLALRAAEVRRQNDFCALFDQQLEGRQGFDDASRIGDDHLAIFFFQGHVEIHADEDAFASCV